MFIVASVDTGSLLVSVVGSVVGVWLSAVLSVLVLVWSLGVVVWSFPAESVLLVSLVVGSVGVVESLVVAVVSVVGSLEAEGEVAVLVLVLPLVVSANAGTACTPASNKTANVRMLIDAIGRILCIRFNLPGLIALENR